MKPSDLMALIFFILFSKLCLKAKVAKNSSLKYFTKIQPYRFSCFYQFLYQIDVRAHELQKVKI